MLLPLPVLEDFCGNFLALLLRVIGLWQLWIHSLRNVTLLYRQENRLLGQLKLLFGQGYLCLTDNACIMKILICVRVGDRKNEKF